MHHFNLLALILQIVMASPECYQGLCEQKLYKIHDGKSRKFHAQADAQLSSGHIDHYFIQFTKTNGSKLAKFISFERKTTIEPKPRNFKEMKQLYKNQLDVYITCQHETEFLVLPIKGYSLCYILVFSIGNIAYKLMDDGSTSPIKDAGANYVPMNGDAFVCFTFIRGNIGSSFIFNDPFVPDKKAVNKMQHLVTFYTLFCILAPRNDNCSYGLATRQLTFINYHTGMYIMSHIPDEKNVTYQKPDCSQFKLSANSTESPMVSNSIKAQDTILFGAFEQGATILNEESMFKISSDSANSNANTGGNTSPSRKSTLLTNEKQSLYFTIQQAFGTSMLAASKGSSMNTKQHTFGLWNILPVCESRKLISLHANILYQSQIVNGSCNPMLEWQQKTVKVAKVLGETWVIGSTSAALAFMALAGDKTYERGIHICQELLTLMAHLTVFFLSERIDSQILCQFSIVILQYVYLCLFAVLLLEAYHAHCFTTNIKSAGAVLPLRVVVPLIAGVVGIAVALTVLLNKGQLVAMYSCWINYEYLSVTLSTHIPVLTMVTLAIILMEDSQMRHLQMLVLVNKRQYHMAKFNMFALWIKLPLHFASWLLLSFAIYIQDFPFYATVFFLNVALGVTIFSSHVGSCSKAFKIIRKFGFQCRKM